MININVFVAGSKKLREHRDRLTIWANKKNYDYRRRNEDIDYANISEPDYIGFIFANTRRYVSPEDAKALKGGLDSKIKAVGVFVNEDVSEMKPKLLLISSVVTVGLVISASTMIVPTYTLESRRALTSSTALSTFSIALSVTF